MAKLTKERKWETMEENTIIEVQLPNKAEFTLFYEQISLNLQETNNSHAI